MKKTKRESIPDVLIMRMNGVIHAFLVLNIHRSCLIKFDFVRKLKISNYIKTTIYQNNRQKLYCQRSVIATASFLGDSLQCSIIWREDRSSTRS